MLLLDLSESLNEKVAGGSQTILELSQEAVSLLAWAIECLGDPFAIAGFHSNTRHDVRYQHIKGFSEHWDDDGQGAPGGDGGRLLDPHGRRRCAMPATTWPHRKADKKHPAVPHRRRAGRHRRRTIPNTCAHDAKKAVEELATKGITTFCISLDPKADDYVRDIFGSHWHVLDRIERLPEKLPLLYMALTK